MKKRQIVAIKDMSAGNDSVGDMWQETKIFNSDDPISNILEWAFKVSDNQSRKRVTITMPHDDDLI